MSCAVHAGLTRGHAFARHDDRLDILQEIVRAAGAGGGRDHDAARAAIDGDYRPCCERGILQDKQERQKKNYSSHVTLSESSRPGSLPAKLDCAIVPQASDANLRRGCSTVLLPIRGSWRSATPQWPLAPVIRRRIMLVGVCPVQNLRSYP